MTIYAFTDGAARGNPGESGIGIVLKDKDGNMLFTGAGYIGTKTNNAAEYEALLACIKKTSEITCTKLIVHSDSELMVRQLQGKYRVKEKTLQQYYLQVQQLIQNAPFEFEIVHIKREHNRDADLLANEGIDNRQALKI